MPPRSLTACSPLPPEGTAAPAVWQSQFRGPYWWERAGRTPTFAWDSLRIAGATLSAGRLSRICGRYVHAQENSSWT